MVKTFDRMVEVDQDKLVSDKMVEDFNQTETPLKIKKIKLLETVGLPISKMEFIKKENFDDFAGMVLERLRHQDCPLIVRFACMPDKLSMPFFYIEEEASEDERDRIIEKIYSLTNNDQTIKFIILQDATSAESAKDKISGRILFEKGEMMPTQEILEIYKGARSTNILNSVDINDPNFQRFVKNAGEFMKPTKKLDAESSINEGEIRAVHNSLKMYREKIETIIGIIVKSQNKSINDMTISIEFSYRDGKIVFSDIDF